MVEMVFGVYWMDRKKRKIETILKMAQIGLFSFMG